jgi:hypothetical protein
MERWELNRIERLENRVDKLEWKNRERSTFWFNFALYGMVTALLVLTAVVIAIHASNPHG